MESIAQNRSQRPTGVRYIPKKHRASPNQPTPIPEDLCMYTTTPKKHIDEEIYKKFKNQLRHLIKNRNKISMKLTLNTK